MGKFKVISTNTILYSRHWEKTLGFYRDALSLEVNFATDWFVEFLVSETARISIADERKTSVKTSEAPDITIALQVDDVQSVRHDLLRMGLAPTEIKDHPWSARVFYIFDPEGRRLKFRKAMTAWISP